MDLLFAAKKPWTWTAEANFKRLKLEHPEIAHDAHRLKHKDSTVRSEEGKS